MVTIITSDHLKENDSGNMMGIITSYSISRSLHDLESSESQNRYNIMWLTVLQIWYPFKLLEPKATQKSQINFFNIGLKWGTHFREKSSLYGTETLSSVNLCSPDTNMDILWNCICFSTCGKFQSFGLTQ